MVSLSYLERPVVGEQATKRDARAGDGEPADLGARIGENESMTSWTALHT